MKLTKEQIKKPSERIKELAQEIREDEKSFSHNESVQEAIIQYLDEQAEIKSKLAEEGEECGLVMGGHVNPEYCYNKKPCSIHLKPV